MDLWSLWSLCSNARQTVVMITAVDCIIVLLCAIMFVLAVVNVFVLAGILGEATAKQD